MLKLVVRFLNKMHRGILICGGFALFMLLGAFLLMLPFCQTGTREISFVDAHPAKGILQMVGTLLYIRVWLHR